MFSRGVIHFSFAFFLSGILIFLLLFILVDSDAASAFSGSGSGTSGDPFEITNCTQLQEMNDNLTAHYELTNNIDCSDTVNWNSGAGFLPVGNATNSFEGDFDGDNYNISGLHINRSDENYVGLFGYVNVTSISNFSFSSPVVIGGNFTGPLAGFSKGNLSSISIFAGQMNGSFYVGGIVGHNEGNLTNVSFNGFVDGFSFVGGVVGQNGPVNLMEGGLIFGSYVIANVTGSGNFTGGFVGANKENTSIQNSYSYGVNVSALNFSSGGGYDYGGFVGGLNDGNITSSYVRDSSISGFKRVGGFVGNNGEWINDSFVNGTVVNGFDEVGGFVGRSAGVINNSHSINNSVNGSNIVAGFIGTTNLAHIDRSYSSNNSVTGINYTSGFVGQVVSGTNVSSSYSRFSIIEGFAFVGGFVGINQGGINNSYSLKDNISASFFPAGGFMGLQIVGGLISYSYSVSDQILVSGYTPGGFGDYSGGVVQDSFWDADYVGGGLGDSSQGNNVSGISANTTAQMKSILTFNDTWDFNGTWLINDTVNFSSYPCLVWEGFCEGDFISTDSCDGVDNNNNGEVDEGFGTLSCGIGACFKSINACIGGVSQSCVPGTPLAEVCDGIDNDCDGSIDEGVCGAGTPVPSSSGGGGGGGGGSPIEEPVQIISLQLYQGESREVALGFNSLSSSLPSSISLDLQEFISVQGGEPVVLQFVVGEEAVLGYYTGSVSLSGKVFEIHLEIYRKNIIQKFREFSPLVKGVAVAFSMTLIWLLILLYFIIVRYIKIRNHLLDNRRLNSFEKIAAKIVREE